MEPRQTIDIKEYVPRTINGYDIFTEDEGEFLKFCMSIRGLNRFDYDDMLTHIFSEGYSDSIRRRGEKHPERIKVDSNSLIKTS